MMGFLVRPLDRIAIRGAMSSVTVVDGCGNIDAAEKVLREPDLFAGGSEPARDLTFQSGHEFQFTSPGDNPVAREQNRPWKILSRGQTMADQANGHSPPRLER